MPLTKQELIERCDKLYEMGLQSNSLNLMMLEITTYILTAAIFKDITDDESFELKMIYLNKINDIEKTKNEK